MSTAMSAVQQGMYVVMTTDSALLALLPNGADAIRDSVPKSPSYPLLVIGDAVEVPDRHIGEDGHEVLFEVSIYTQDGSTAARTVRGGTTGFRAGLEIMARLHELIVGDAVGNRALTVTNFVVVDADVDFSQTGRDTDGITRIIDVRYRLRLEPGVPL